MSATKELNAALRGMYGLQKAPVSPVTVQIAPDHVYIPSSTPGHAHLIVKKSLTKMDYLVAMNLLAKSGLVENGYVWHSVRRGFSAVRRPGVVKPESQKKKKKYPPEKDVALKGAGKVSDLMGVPDFSDVSETSYPTPVSAPDIFDVVQWDK